MRCPAGRCARRQCRMASHPCLPWLGRTSRGSGRRCNRQLALYFFNLLPPRRSVPAGLRVPNLDRRQEAPQGAAMLALPVAFQSCFFLPGRRMHACLTPGSFGPEMRMTCLQDAKTAAVGVAVPATGHVPAASTVTQALAPAGCAPAVTGAIASCMCTKRSRPPSWVRKRRSRARLGIHGTSAAVKPLHDATNIAPPRSGDKRPRIDAAAPTGHSAADSDPFSSEQRRCGSALARSKRARRGSGARMRTLRPRSEPLSCQAALFQPAWTGRSGLPAQHPLSHLSAAPAVMDAATQLMRCIWGRAAPRRATAHCHKLISDSAVRLHPAQQQALAPILSDLLARAAHVPYTAILQSTCPLPGACGQKCLAPLSPWRGSVLSKATAPQRVCTFVRAVLNRMLPPALLGSGQRTFLARVGSFLALRRHEQMSLHDVLQGMPIRGVAWLQALCAALLSCALISAIAQFISSIAERHSLHLGLARECLINWAGHSTGSCHLQAWQQRQGAHGAAGAARPAALVAADRSCGAAAACALLRYRRAAGRRRAALLPEAGVAAPRVRGFAGPHAVAVYGAHQASS
jgi:Telomerase ribonucleoprotein complex - RNA binding domain